MSRLEDFCCASIVAPPLQAPTGARAGSRRLRILCDDARLDAMCNELARALANAQPALRVEVAGSGHAAEDAHLTLRFVTTRFTERDLSGHLAWQDGTGRTGRGTSIELTVLDAPFDDRAMRDYARQLLSFTRLPL